MTQELNSESAHSRLWWLKEGKRREREAICRLITRIGYTETSPKYRNFLREVAKIIHRRKNRDRE